jgi:hypothetical protein
MLKINFEINGRSVSPANIEDAIESMLLQQIEQIIHARLAGVRDPETGEFPIVAVRGKGLKNLSFAVNGSEKLVEIVKQRLGNDFALTDEDGDAAMDQNVRDGRRSPVAFLSYASENKQLATRIAEDFQARGIDTFFADWEIGPGDSIRAKIDAGLGNCTHFVVLLTPESINKPWVNTEIDAGFVAKVESRCKFIPLRSNLPIERLSFLLRSLRSPALDKYDQDLREVIDFIHGVTKKPPLGRGPAAVEQASGKLDLSPAAEMIVKLFVDRSKHGDKFDPQLGADELRKATSLTDDDILDAVDELESRGFVGRFSALGDGPLGFLALYPETALFSEFDGHFKEWNPSVDARQIAADLVNGDRDLHLPELAEKYGWAPRRMNPAANYLFERRLVESSRLLGTSPWSLLFLRKNPKTRRFLCAV